ncbi:hypothetical protein BUE64_05830 [Corynebacterium diphtheriae subsp. lausannense]|nr:hypothetical protein BUE64_05830 [Corynebacterium diphtheriae subsp. lausannense]
MQVSTAIQQLSSHHRLLPESSICAGRSVFRDSGGALASLADRVHTRRHQQRKLLREYRRSIREGEVH